ncbi:hypothetical protein SEA_UPYO_49 [Gordonia phage Upyo]|nr:hypothetical protein SEA_UPYO_49 [Gordonia phage Upyo]
MSTDLPTPFPAMSAGPLRLHEDVWNNVDIVQAEDLAGKHLDREVLFKVVLREAKLPALVHASIRRVHHHADAVEIDVTNLDDDYTEWTTYVLAPSDAVYFLGRPA